MRKREQATKRERKKLCTRIMTHHLQSTSEYQPELMDIKYFFFAQHTCNTYTETYEFHVLLLQINNKSNHSSLRTKNIYDIRTPCNIYKRVYRECEHVHTCVCIYSIAYSI